MEKRIEGCRQAAEGVAMHTCQKYGIAMGEACLKCRDPKIYCKFRSSCTIHFLTRRHADRERETPRN